MNGQSLVPEDFPARVKAGRAYAGDMSQGDLARELGMSAGYVKMVEGGKGLKDLEARSLLERLPEITGLPRSFFTGEEKAGDGRLDAILEYVTRIDERLERFAEARLLQQTAEAEAEASRRTEGAPSAKRASQRGRRQ